MSRAHAKTVHVGDLFCGAGGTSTGLIQAAEAMGRRVELTAVNHWETAVETHAKNHPAANHFCTSLDSLDPRKAVPGGVISGVWVCRDDRTILAVVHTERPKSSGVALRCPFCPGGNAIWIEGDWPKGRCARCGARVKK